MRLSVGMLFELSRPDTHWVGLVVGIRRGLASVLEIAWYCPSGDQKRRYEISQDVVSSWIEAGIIRPIECPRAKAEIILAGHFDS